MNRRQLMALVEAQTTGRQEQARHAPQAGPLRTKQPERDWQATVLKYATLRGWRTYHTWISLRSAPGFPDLVLVRRPHVIFAELKSERGALSEKQEAWLEELRACGQNVFVWRPGDWPEVERVLA